MIGVETTEQKVGIGNGNGSAAPAIGDRPGARAGAFGADLQQAGPCDPRDAAAAGADCVDVYQRHAQRHTVGDVLLRAQRRFAGGDQRNIEAGPAHVAGDKVGIAGLHADARRGDRSGGRAGQASPFPSKVAFSQIVMPSRRNIVAMEGLS